MAGREHDLTWVKTTFRGHLCMQNLWGVSQAWQGGASDEEALDDGVRMVGRTFQASKFDAAQSISSCTAQASL